MKITDTGYGEASKRSGWNKEYTDRVMKKHREAAVLDHPDGSVITEKLRDGAVVENKLAGNAVSEGKIRDGAVTERKLADSAVTVNKIKNGAITDEKIGERTIIYENKYHVFGVRTTETLTGHLSALYAKDDELEHSGELLQSKLDEETTARQSTDAELEQKITAEKNERIRADNEMRNQIGELPSLATDEKRSLVGAVNEVKNEAAELDEKITDERKERISEDQKLRKATYDEWNKTMNDLYGEAMEQTASFYAEIIYDNLPKRITGLTDNNAVINILNNVLCDYMLDIDDYGVFNSAIDTERQKWDIDGRLTINESQDYQPIAICFNLNKKKIWVENYGDSGYGSGVLKFYVGSVEPVQFIRDSDGTYTADIFYMFINGGAEHLEAKLTFEDNRGLWLLDGADSFLDAVNCNTVRLDEEITDERKARTEEDNRLQSQIGELTELIAEEKNKLSGEIVERKAADETAKKVSAEHAAYALQMFAGITAELKKMYEAIGVRIYDGGMFGMAYTNGALDGGAFEDETDAVIDCGGFEPIKISVETAAVGTRIDCGAY